MEVERIYDALADKMDRGVVMGVPKTPVLIEILKILFPVEDLFDTGYQPPKHRFDT